MTVQSWFMRFTPTLMETVRRGDWPEGDSEYWPTMARALARIGATEAAATEAAQLLAEDPPAHLGDVIPRLVDKVRAVVKSAPAGSGPESREAAYASARDCPDCRGDGWAVRYRHQSAGPGRAEHISLYCVCAMGRFLECAHRTGDESAREIHRRTPDLAELPALQLGPVAWSLVDDNRHRYRLADWDPALDRPRPVALPDLGRAGLAKIGQGLDA